MKKPLALLAPLLCACALNNAYAELSDRSKPTQWEADSARHDDLNQVTVLEGNVVITRGTFVLRAQRVEMRQDPEGFQFGIATGSANAPALFRQKRDGIEQFVEGDAQRIDYDGKADRVTLTGAAQMRRLEAGAVADEVAGQVIVYDSRAEKYSVTGGHETASPTNPQGRVRGTIAPRAPAPDAAAPNNAAPLRPADAVGNATPPKR